jgi:hypothetical protein
VATLSNAGTVRRLSTCAPTGAASKLPTTNPKIPFFNFGLSNFTFLN